MSVLDRNFTIDSDLVARHIAGRTIIVPVRARACDLDSIYTLNDSGSMIWQMICEGAAGHQLVDALCHEYEVDAEDAARDAAVFLDDLAAASLIHVAVENLG